MTLTFQEAAQILKISPATVRNWLKAGVLKSTQLAHVKETKTKIKNGVLQKLQKGANKHHSSKLHSHSELLSDKRNSAVFRPLLERYKKQNKELLLAVYLRQLVELNLVSYTRNKFTLNDKLRAELEVWNVTLQSPRFLSVYHDIEKVQADFSDNILSFLHQSLSETSAKQDLGAYFTPASAVKKALKNISRPGKVCDPCCGSGNFLVQAYMQMQSQKWPSPETSVFGYDCDPLAVLLARANLTLASLNRIDVLKAVQLKDFLFDPPAQEFTYIITNPPWGSYSENVQTARLQKKFSLTRTKDSFSFFILSSMQTITKNGSGHFILPVSFMNVSAHSEFRKYLFSSWTVTRIELLEEKFSGVMSAAVIVSVHNRRPGLSHEVEISSKDICHLPNAEILKTENFIVPLNNDATSLQVLREVESASRVTLQGQSTWGLGLVTGNNKKFLYSKAAKGRVPVIKGRQVFRYRQPLAGSFCDSDTSLFQQTAPVHVYRARKKLVYRFIAKELVFAIDTAGFFTLNSANILIPESELYSCEFLCGLFNSKLGQYYFSKKYSSIKVLRSHLENFPLPEFNKGLFSRIEKCVAQLQKEYSHAAADTLDDVIIKAYGLSAVSEAAVKSYKLNKAFN